MATNAEDKPKEITEDKTEDKAEDKTKEKTPEKVPDKEKETPEEEPTKKDVEPTEHDKLVTSEDTINKKRQINIFLLLVSVATVICILIYIGVMIASFARGNVNDVFYYAYAAAATTFVPLMSIVFTANAGLFLASVKLSNPSSDNKKSKDSGKLITIQERYSIENTIKDLHDISNNTVLSIFGLYFFFTFLFLAISAIFWGIIIAHYHQNNFIASGYEYIAVNVCAGFVAPVSLLISLTIGMMLVSYYTKDRVSMRNVIPTLFYSVKLKQKLKPNADIVQSAGGDPGIDPSDLVHKNTRLEVDYLYWDIQNQFKWDLAERKNWYPWLEPHVSTWCLWVIICISITVAFAQFIDATVISEVASTICLLDHNCFLPVSTYNFERFPCATGNLTALGITGSPTYYCFRFRDFGFDSNVILAVGNAYALYLVQIALFDKILSGYHTFLHLKLDIHFTITYVAVPTLTAILIFISNVINDYQAVLYDVLRTWNLFNVLLYHIVVALFITTYRWQKQFMENYPGANSKAQKTNDIPLVPVIS